MSQTGIEYLSKLPLRGLKIMRKGNRKLRKDPNAKLMLKDLNTVIKHKQSLPRKVFEPNYISRKRHRMAMATMDNKAKT